MAGCLRVILGDQLTETLSVITDADKNDDWFLMAEVREEATYVKHHKKKIAFLFSAMRHFAQKLKDKGYQLAYTYYDDPENSGSLLQEVKRHVCKYVCDQVTVTAPGEYRLMKSIEQWSSVLGVPVNVLEDERFISQPRQFSEWASSRKQLRMEYFYRELRKQTGILMEQGAPVGGQWNFDHQNREPMPKGTAVPTPLSFDTDTITQDVLVLVKTHFSDHFGDLEPFHFAVTREQALEVLEHFLLHRLPDFGRYQDAMVESEPWMFHSLLSFYLNCGLLTPLEVLRRAEEAYLEGWAPLNSVEGFVRQILGWREYVRGFYWHFMPQLAHDNALNAQRSLPGFFWDSYTNMNCLRQCIKETKENAYAHHIQRLMVVGNFCLLAGINPYEVQEWYLLVYADAYEWVELPNVSAMILFADGGELASKPYAASGSYINKMSDYCKNCGYQVSKKSGDKACPFNYLYWHFIDTHQQRLRANPRMGLIYKSYERMSESNLQAMKTSAETFLLKLENGQEV